MDACALRQKTEQKMATSNMTSCLQFGQYPPTPTAPFPDPAVEMKIINSYPHRQRKKGLISTPIPGGGTIWIHPDLLGFPQKVQRQVKAGECHHRLHHL